MPADNIDPVCGAPIVDDQERTNERATFDGVEYQFCSAECRQKFEANPTAYVAEPQP